MIEIGTAAQDDPAFLARVETVAMRVARLRPRRIYVLRIDNWFGKRWVGFAGKLLGALGVNYRAELTIPPFVPNRVLDQTCYELTEAGEYVAVDSGAPVHIAQTSSASFRRKVSELFPDGALIWFSSNSKTNRRGSILAYVPAGGAHEAWFAEFRGDPEWRVCDSFGVTPAELA